VKRRGPRRRIDLLTEAPERDRADKSVEAKLREELVCDVEGDAAEADFGQPRFREAQVGSDPRRCSSRCGGTLTGRPIRSRCCESR
jgi:hypothetical protein